MIPTPYLTRESCGTTSARDCSPLLPGLRARFVFEVVGGKPGTEQTLVWGRACGSAGPGGVTVTHVTNQATAQAFATAIEAEWPEATATVGASAGGAYRVSVEWNFSGNVAGFAAFRNVAFTFCNTCLI